MTVKPDFRFASEAEAKATLPFLWDDQCRFVSKGPGWDAAPVAVRGAVIGTVMEEGVEYPVYELVSGWHLKVRAETPEAEALFAPAAPFEVSPGSQSAVWA